MARYPRPGSSSCGILYWETNSMVWGTMRDHRLFSYTDATATKQPPNSIFCTIAVRQKMIKTQRLRSNKKLYCFEKRTLGYTVVLIKNFLPMPIVTPSNFRIYSMLANTRPNLQSTKSTHRQHDSYLSVECLSLAQHQSSPLIWTLRIPGAHPNHCTSSLARDLCLYAHLSIEWYRRCCT